MAKYVGQEHTMYLKICKKYNVQPEPEITGQPSQASSGFGGLSSGGLGFGGQPTGGLFGASSGMAPATAPATPFGGTPLGMASAASSSSPFGAAAPASPFGGRTFDCWISWISSCQVVALELQPLRPHLEVCLVQPWEVGTGDEVHL